MSKGYFLQISSILFNSISLLMNKFILQNISFINVVFINMIFSILISLSYYKDIIKSTNFYSLKTYLPIAMINMLGMMSLYYSMEKISPTSFGIITRFYILFAIFISIKFLGEKFSINQIFLTILSIVGGILFIVRDSEMDFSFVPVVICLISSLCFATSYSMIKIKQLVVEPKIAFAYNNMIGVIPLTFYFAINNKQLVYPSFNNMLLAIVSSISFFLSMVSFFKGLKYLSFSKSNMLRSFSPIVLTIISFPFFPEQLSPTNILGGIIVFLSLMFIGVSKNDTKKHSK